MLNNFRHDFVSPAPYFVETEATPAHLKLLGGTQLGRVYLGINEEVRLAIISDRSFIYLVWLGNH